MELNQESQELCERQGGHPGLLVPSKPYGFCGCKATLRKELDESSGAV